MLFKIFSTSGWFSPKIKGTTDPWRVNHQVAMLVIPVHVHCILTPFRTYNSNTYNSKISYRTATLTLVSSPMFVNVCIGFLYLINQNYRRHVFSLSTFTQLFGQIIYLRCPHTFEVESGCNFITNNTEDYIITSKNI